MELEQILKVAVRGGASDIILKTGAVPRFRLDGNLVPLSDGQTIRPEVMQAWIQQIMPRHLLKKFEAAGDVDFAFQSAKGYRFRVSLFRQRQSFGMVMRVISQHIRTLEELQMPPALHGFAHERRGLILVTGATGSGKSTTLAAIIQKINAERAAHVITIEDPIEFSFEDAQATINQREIGTDAQSFGRALRSALRQNPDVILVGELRDQETTETALMAAETGHLVFSTLHTVDAVETFTRIMSYFPPHQHATLRMMLSSTVRAVVSQRLIPKADGKGMVAALEVMICNALIRDVILNGKDFEALHGAIRRGADSEGMQSFDQSLLYLYSNGMISYENAIANASRREDLELLIRGVGA